MVRNSFQETDEKQGNGKEWMEWAMDKVGKT